MYQPVQCPVCWSLEGRGRRLGDERIIGLLLKVFLTKEIQLLSKKYQADQRERPLTTTIFLLLMMLQHRRTAAKASDRNHRGKVVAVSSSPSTSSNGASDYVLPTKRGGKNIGPHHP